ncbi:hypothetical protein AOQ84DRAFT_201482 [Glonium stellatum]|uniref:Transcription factor domain-containing protein n=1 Tax=Glonium stellatum TaxID=574774 RepID=A0A8E2ENA9_9PEZI|nr:hypothetical protein AOQ84DRAFT_201482 [Glonium stellatum]
MTNQFPFVVIPPGTTASNFRRDLPLLYRAVIMATSSDYPSRQAFYEKQIVEFVTDHLLIRSHKNLDLLQGILLFITWYKRNTMVVTQLNNLLQLAIALIDDLYLNRSPTWFHKSKVLLALACSRSVKYGPKTMDERRALLGCFYLSSVAATSFQRLDSMRLTRQIEESCQALLEKPEYPTDLQVAYVVKAQYLTDRIAQNIHINEGNIVHSPKTPIEMHIKAFQSEIFAMRESLSPSLRLNTSVLMHLDFASMRLYEVALLDNPQNPTTNPIATDPAHLENLYSLLLSTKSFITATLATPGATYLSLSYIAWTQFTYSVAVLDRLTFFKSPSCPSWDVPFVRSVIDLSTVLSTFAGRFEQAREHTCSQMMPGENSLRVEQANLYNRYALRTQMVREWFEHKAKFGNSANWDWEQAKVRLINAFEGKNKGMEQEHTPIPPTMAGYDIVELKDGNMQLDPSLFDGLNDDSFWLNLLGEWGDGPGV